MRTHTTRRGIRRIFVSLLCVLALVAAACAEEDDDSDTMAAVDAAAASAATAQSDAGAALGEAQAARAEASAADAEAASAAAAADAAGAEAAAAAALAEEAIAAAEVAKATAEGNQADVAAAEAALEAAQEAAAAAQAEAANAQAEAAAAQDEAAAAQAEAANAQAEAEEARSAAQAAASEAAAAEAAAESAAAESAMVADELPAFGTPERCEANRAAGKLTFMTGFDFAAAAGIIDIIVAEDEGFFDDMCLDVEIQPGFAPGNSAALAAGTVQLGATATFGELVRQNVAGDADIMAFAQLGHTAISQLLISPDAGVTDLADLEGMTVGIKGDIPVAIEAMMAEAGLQRGTFTELLLEGFNPVEHFALGIDALPVYRSNEPRWLDLAGIDYITFDPLDYDVPASFAIYVTTRSFYEEHPTVVEDFVRAGLRGYHFAVENPEAAIDHAFERIEAAGNNLFFAREHETFRMTTDQEIIENVTPRGLAIGQLNPPRLGEEIQNLVNLGVYDELPDWQSMMDATLVPRLYDGDQLIWASMN
ncbi:MAG: ABC transporter substrate-binding protein [Acidimicrobiia bacterium]|nr:ABC transporter substrate-binding protein [Acidimicrobiia bacterium]